MAVRKIPKNHLVVTGGYSSQKNNAMDAFESPLEKDYFLLLDFDDAVESFEPQPLNIPVPGVPKGYVPDVLVRYKPSPNTGKAPKSILVDVKHTDDLQRNGEKYAKKFECAKLYAEGQGWEFKIIDQNQIRTPRLQNLKFLREFRNIEPEPDAVRAVYKRLGSAPQPHPEILGKLAKTTDEKLHWLPIIWFAVLKGHAVADMDKPFGSEVLLTRGKKP